MEETTFDVNGILSPDEISSLFDSDSKTDEKAKSAESDSENVEEKDNSTAEEIDASNLFSESVGSEDNNEDKGDPDTSKEVGASPSFYSSIADALKEDGILPDLNDDEFKDVTTAEGLASLIEKQIQAGLTETQRRVSEALDLGIEPSKIKQFENTISYLKNIKESDITAETEQANQLRAQLIRTDYYNRGYSQDRIERELKKSLDSGSDIDDAKDALAACLDFYQKNYDNLIQQAKNEENAYKTQLDNDSAAFKKLMLEDTTEFGGIPVDKSTRQKAYDQMMKPAYKDKKTGETLTAMQKYQRENYQEFMKNVGFLYTLTDGFKNFDKLADAKAKKVIKKGLSSLEQTLNNTTRQSGGGLKYVTGTGNAPSQIGEITLDI